MVPQSAMVRFGAVLILWWLFSGSANAWSVQSATADKDTPPQAAGQFFQKAVQEQTFETILTTIEARLRNLDNIYSMQLSETLRTKLELYNRKLDALDIKIIRLESMMMLNLDRISENISSKNYRDNVAKAQTHRKLDGIYESLDNKIGQLDRKVEFSFARIEKKVDVTIDRLDKIEVDMMELNTDVEAEVSRALSIMEECKSEATQNAPRINSTILETTLRGINKRLDVLENKTTNSLSTCEESKTILSLIRSEVKEDFNSYANKVADMNVDIWKRNDIAEEDLKTIETLINSTRIDVQNSVRALTIQIGKLAGKGTSPSPEKTSLESLKKSLNLNLEKIMTNQELFLESCHRVQMDESQIETEISGMLGKLIDMLETKMTVVMKDLKSIDKTVKSHDSRTTRNLNQANNNVITLFEKSTKADETFKVELQELKHFMNSLFTLMQNGIQHTNASKNLEHLIQNNSISILNLKELLTNFQVDLTTKYGLMDSDMRKNRNLLQRLRNVTEIVVTNTRQLLKDTKTPEKLQLSEEARLNQTILELFGNPAVAKQQNKTKKTCLPSWSDLINIRSGDDCIEPNTKKNSKIKHKVTSRIDLRADSENSNKNTGYDQHYYFIKTSDETTTEWTTETPSVTTTENLTTTTKSSNEESSSP